MEKKEKEKEKKIVGSLIFFVRFRIELTKERNFIVFYLDKFTLVLDL